VAALAAVTGVILYLRSAPPGEAPVGVDVAVGGGGASVVVGGRF
jgi:hypothetical protein